jgi:toxin HigB-1
MIVGFRSRETEKVWNGEVSRRLPAEIQSIARRKLRYLNNARSLSDLRIPPGNMLEALKRDLAGCHSIRINDPWRICFRWTSAGPDEVEIVDYH